MENAPNYSEMLLLNEEEHKMWVVRWIESPYRDLLIQQMVEHEEQTHSLANSVRPEEVTDSTEKIYSLFVPETTANTKDIFLRVWKETGIDLIKHAIMAKAATDYYSQRKES